MTMLQHSVIESGGYNIDRSLRFRSSATAYLSRTPASANTNDYKATFATWLKIGTLGVGTCLINTTSGGTNNPSGGLFLEATGVLHYRCAQYGTTFDDVSTLAVFRDPSAWYHIVLSVDTTASGSNRVRIWVNGVLQTLGTNGGVQWGNIPTYMIQNGQQARINSASYWGGSYNDIYLAELFFIDGQALTPSSFGQTDPVTGVWQPKKYTGTYGTNGFYLPFSDNTSATTLAYDKSGNGNNWTANNISTTAGATYDSMTDVPTLTSATAANFAVLNPLYGSPAPTNGNLAVSLSTQTSYGTISFTTGKWYWEVTVTAALPSSGYIGVMDSTYLKTDNGWSSQARSYINSGSKYDGSSSAYGASWTNGDVIGVAVDMSAGTIVFYKNGTSQGTAFSDLIGKEWRSFVYATTGSYAINFGQRPFSYTPPTGFKALNTFNLPDPTIKKPNQYMDATTYTGNGTYPRSITNAAGFQPDLVWTKARSTTYSHVLYDSVRGTGVYKDLSSDLTSAEGTNGGIYCNLTSFDAGGWTIGSTSSTNILNNNGTTFVGWQWKKGATPGFDIVTYTGTGSARTVSHSLGVVPSMIIVKRRDSTGNWPVQHASVNIANGIYLNVNNAAVSATTLWNSTLPSASVFSIGTSTDVNVNGGTYVAYCWAAIPGYSSFGSFVGNGSTDGVFVHLGLRPKYVLVKRTDVANDWLVLDSARDTYNVVGNDLYADLSNAEIGGQAIVDFTSNGFKIRQSYARINASGGTYIYAAFAENPFKYSNAR